MGYMKKKRRQKRAAFVAASVSALFFAACCLYFFAPLAPALDALSDFKLHMTAAGGVLFVGLLAMARPKSALAALAGGLLSLGTILANLDDLSTADPDSCVVTFSISVYNLHGRDALTIGAARSIEAAPSDIVVVVGGSDRFDWPAAAKAFAAYYRQADYSAGTLVLSNIESAEGGRWSGSDGSNGKFPWLRFDLADGRRFMLVVVDSPSAEDARTVAGFIKTQDIPVVAAGGFGASPYGLRASPFMSEAGLKSGAWLTPTWPAAWPFFARVPRDYALHHPGLIPVARRTLPDAGLESVPAFYEFGLK